MKPVPKSNRGYRQEHPVFKRDSELQDIKERHAITRESVARPEKGSINIFTGKRQ